MDEENIKLCQRNDYWKITKPDNDCWFLSQKRELTCGDCDRLGSDSMCIGYGREDSAYDDGKLCFQFSDRKETDFYERLCH